VELQMMMLIMTNIIVISYSFSKFLPDSCSSSLRRCGKRRGSLHTPALAAARMEFFSRYNYEVARNTNKLDRSLSDLSYDEALAVAPAIMDDLPRYNYKATLKEDPSGAPSLYYDEAFAYVRIFGPYRLKIVRRAVLEFYTRIFT